MNISSTSASTSLTSLLNTGQSARIGIPGEDDGSAGSAAAGAHRRHHGGAQALFDALKATLNQLGLSKGQPDDTSATPPDASGSGADASATATATASVTASSSGTKDTGSAHTGSAAAGAAGIGTGQGVDPALRAFMHALFQAAQADGGSNELSQATAPTATGRHAYGDLSSKVQDLLQSLGSGGAAGNTADGGLTTAFQHLLQTLDSASAADSDSSTVPVSLQSFAQDLLHNLQSGAPSPFDSAGSLVSTTV